jgi:hypothetical protein
MGSWRWWLRRKRSEDFGMEELSEGVTVSALRCVGAGRVSQLYRPMFTALEYRRRSRRPGGRRYHLLRSIHIRYPEIQLPALLIVYFAANT